jgi:hypothetical protein
LEQYPPSSGTYACCVKARCSSGNTGAFHNRYLYVHELKEMSIVPYLVCDSAVKNLQTGFSREETLDLQAGEGESVMKGGADDVRHKVVRGELVAKIRAEMEADSPREPIILPEQQLAPPMLSGGTLKPGWPTWSRGFLPLKRT